MWGDSLSASQITDWINDTVLSDSQAALRMARMIGLCGPSSPFGDTASDSSVRQLADQLALRTGVSWKTKSVALVLAAVRAVAQELDRGTPLHQLTVRLDSMARGYGALLYDSTESLSIDSTDFVSTHSPAERVALFASRSLMLSQAAARVVADFVLSENTEVGSSDPTAMVRDLIRNGAGRLAAAPKTVRKSATEPPRAQLPTALQLRSLASIRDSIARHSANVKSIYKKALKTNGGLRGQVWLTFHVAPSGAVAQVSIFKSHITDSSFLAALRGYAKEIRFQPIPATAGEMTFHFPFDFAPE